MYSSPMRARFVNVIDCQRKNIDEVAPQPRQHLKQLRNKLKIALTKSISMGEDSTPISKRGKRVSTRASSPNKRSTPRSEGSGSIVHRSSIRLLELGSLSK
jgi:hypothetical protein